MAYEYELGYDDVNINDLARFITQVVTGRERDRVVQKRVKQNIADALDNGSLQETSKGCVNAYEFFKWAFERKSWKEYWPDIRRVKGVPSIDTVVKINAASSNNIAFGVDALLVPNSREQLKVLYLEAITKTKLLTRDNENLRVKVKLLESELEIFRDNELKHKKSSRKGGQRSRGKKKEY